MKKKIIFILLIFFSFSINGNLLAQTEEAPSSGDGTAGNPYQIANLNNLYWLSQNPTAWSSNYIQTADIDATAVVSLDGGAGFTPIGTNPYNSSGTAFTGTYNGQGHTISNLFINRGNTDHIGLFGYVNTADAKIENLGVTDANITGKNLVGALVGINYQGYISNSYNTGSVTGNSKVGGLVGNNNSYGIISNSYSTGSVIGNSKVGGLLGDNYMATITNSYSTSIVNGTTNVGGLVGNNMIGSISNSFWDTETSNQATDGVGSGSSNGITGKTTAEMQQASTFTDANWNFSYIWKIDEGNGYPNLLPPPPTAIQPEGSGTVDDPYKIASLENLYWLSQNPTAWSSNYIQTADIDATAVVSLDGDKGFSPIGNSTTKFTGTYNGQRHTISNLFINRPETYHVGLFGYGGSTFKVENLGVTDANITGKNAVGGLVGRNLNNGTISNSYSQGSIIIGINNNVGGLVGNNNGTISNSYSTGSITKTETGNSVGGLVGKNKGGTINNSYSTGSITKTETGNSVGGLVGKNKGGTITNSYATGSVTGNNSGGLVGSNSDGTISSSFWNTETSSPATNGVGSGSSDGVTGKTTAEMQQASTFTDWDFVNTWSINEDSGYPYLFPSIYTWDGEKWEPELELPIEEGTEFIFDFEFTLGTTTPTDFPTGCIITVIENGNVIVPENQHLEAKSVNVENGNLEIQADGNATVTGNLEVKTNGTVLINSAIRDENGELSKASGSLIVDGEITNNGGTMTSKVTIDYSSYTDYTAYRKFYISKPISENFNTSSFTFAADGKILKLENGRSTEVNNENMEIGQGYDIRNVDAQTVTFNGTFNNLNEYELSVPPRKRRSALAGNPYPCAIDWDEESGWIKTDLRTSVYIWSEALGRLSSWNGTTGTNGRTNGIIPTMCGFIVKASQNSPSLTVNKAARVHQEIIQNDAKRMNYINDLLRLKVTGKNYSDETVIILNNFISEAENTDKIFEDNEELPHLFTMSEDNFETTINNLFSEDENISIPLHFIAGEHGEFSIEVTENNLNSKNVFIEDKNTGEIKNLENYKFNSKKSDSEDRFVLHFSNENLENIAEKSVKIYSYEKNIYIDNPFEKANVIVYDIAGRKVFEELLNEKSLIKLDIAQKSGTYFVKFYSDNKIVNAKIIL